MANARKAAGPRHQEAAEVMAIGLSALMAGFGFFTYGDTLADFFVAMGNNFDGNTIMMPAFGTNPLTN